MLILVERCLFDLLLSATEQQSGKIEEDADIIGQQVCHEAGVVPCRPLHNSLGEASLVKRLRSFVSAHLLHPVSYTRRPLYQRDSTSWWTLVRTLAATNGLPSHPCRGGASQGSSVGLQMNTLLSCQEVTCIRPSTADFASASVKPGAHWVSNVADGTSVPHC